MNNFFILVSVTYINKRFIGNDFDSRIQIDRIDTITGLMHFLNKLSEYRHKSGFTSA